jgi:hypothetical protein
LTPEVFQPRKPTCACRLCFRVGTTIKYLNLSNKQVTTLYEGLADAGWVHTVSGKAQHPGQPPEIYVSKGQNILLIQPGSPPQQLPLWWPAGFTPDSLDRITLLGSDGDGGVVFTCGPNEKADHSIFYVPLNSGHVQLLAGPPISNASDLPDSPDGYTDWVPGCGWSAPEVPEIRSFILDANGDIVFVPYAHAGDDASLIVRVAVGLKPPAHLQPPPLPSSTISIPTCDPAQLSSDLGSLLQSGEGADVQLRCEGGEVLAAYANILSARWEWFRARQASGMVAAGSTDAGQGEGNAAAYGLQAGATAPASAAGDVRKGDSTASQQAAVPSSSIVVDASGHSAVAMQLILQHLYTGQVMLPGSTSQIAGTNDAHEQGCMRSQVIQLLTAASYYLLPDLHAAVLALAQKLVSPSTALRWLQAAHVVGETALEKAMLQFIRSNLDGECVF